MTIEEKKKAEQARIRALTPRTKDGLLAGVIFEGQQEELLYPYHELDENGLVSPMDFLEDYADGKVPDSLKYAPGYQRKFVPVDDPNYMRSICYDKPELNLSPAERHAIWEWREAKKREPMKITVTGGKQVTASQAGNAEDEKKHVSEFNPEKMLRGEEVEIVVIPSGEMHCRNARDEFFLANFTITAVEHRIVLKSSSVNDVVDEYEVCVKTKGKETNLVLSPKDIDNVIGVIQRKLPMCFVSSLVKKAQALIVNYVRSQLVALPERYYVRVSGFLKIAGRWIFAHDGAEFPDCNVVFQTGRTIAKEARMLPMGAFCQAIDFLGISTKLALTLVMFLVAHLSPMFNLFNTAGYCPRFILFLTGRTGSLKTSTSLIVFRLFIEQPASPEANFKDTEVALEIKLGEGHGKVVLLDDYRPPVTSADGKTNLAKLESVVRAAGDRIAKSRSNPELGKAKEFLPTSCVVVTGEDIGGTQSSQLRMLIVPISKGDINGDLLKKFQDNPLLLSTHMFYFLKWVGDHGDGIINFIQSEFEKERTSFSHSLKEARVVDTAVTLMLTARILQEYGCNIGAIDAGSSTQLLYEWRCAILQAVIESEGISKAQNPVCMYLQALFDMLDRKEIEIARDTKSYEAGVHIGYTVDDSLWLWHKQVYSNVCRYWQRLGILFPLTCEKVNEHLDSAGLIKTCFEKRGDGVKKLYVCKSALPQRSRLLVLNEPLARKYLENESD